MRVREDGFLRSLLPFRHGFERGPDVDDVFAFVVQQIYVEHLGRLFISVQRPFDGFLLILFAVTLVDQFGLDLLLHLLRLCLIGCRLHIKL